MAASTAATPNYHPAEETPSRIGLLCGAFTLFFLSFVVAGDGLSLPQLFFEHFYPDHKTVLLSAALFASTIAGTIAVMLSRRRQLPRRATVTAMLAGVAGILLLYSTASGALFLVTIVTVHFGANYLTNQIDYGSVLRAGEQRRFNDAAGVLARLLGMLAAPAFLTSFYEDKRIVLLGAATIGLIASAGAAKLLSMPTVESKTVESSTESGAPPDRADYFLFAFAASIYISLYLFGANMIYLLRDRLSLTHADTRGGTAIVVMFSSALLANGAAAIIQRKLAERTTRRIRMLPLAVAAVVLFVVSSALAMGLCPPFYIFLSGACLLGISYGVFLWELRDYASYAARGEGKSILVSWFNNIGNLSSLIAFTLMLGFSATGGSAPGSYYVRVLWTIGGGPMVGLIFLAAAGRMVRISRHPAVRFSSAD